MTESAHISVPVATPREAASGERRALALVWLAALVMWLAYYASCHVTAIQLWDPLDYAQVAKQLALGHGFQSSVMPLGGLEWMRQTGHLGGAWWDIHRFPLPSIVEAAFMKVLGPCDLAVTLYSAVFYFASIPLVYAFGRRLFTHRVAITATALFAFGRLQIGDSVNGDTQPAAVFFFLGALYFILWTRNRWSLPIAGLLTGLAYLNRSSTILYVLPMLYLVWRGCNVDDNECAAARGRPSRLWKVLAFCVPAMAIIAPWLIRNAVLTGDPLFNLTTAIMARFQTVGSPVTNDWYQFIYEPAGHFWRTHPGWAVQKWLETSARIWQHLDSIGNLGFLFGFVLLSVVSPMRGLVETLRKWLLVVFVLHFGVLSLLAQLPRYYAIFVPFLIIYGAEAGFRAYDALRSYTRPANALVAGALVGPIAYMALSQTLGPPPLIAGVNPCIEYTTANLDWIRGRTRPGAVIVSDVPWSIAWYSDRRAVPLPPTPAAMSRFADYGLRPDGIYLKAVPDLRAEIPPSWHQWGLVQTGHLTVQGYRLVKVFPDTALYYERANAH